MRTALRATERRPRLGSTTIEFALVAQMFFFLIVGCFDIVSMMNSYSILQWSVTTAARVAMANPAATTSQVQAAAQSAANSAGYTGAVFTVSSAVCGSSTCMTIMGNYSYNFILSKAFCATGSTSTACSIGLTKSLVAPIGSVT